MNGNRLLVISIVCVMMISCLPVMTGADDVSSRDADNNGDFASATPILGNDVTTGATLEGVGDTFDYFKIELNNSGAGNTEKLVVNVTANGNGALRLSIFDPDTYWVATDLTLGQESYLEIMPEFSGWYYICLEGQGMTFPYTIRFQKTSVAWTGDSNTDAANATVVTFPFEATHTFDNKTDTQDFYKVNLEKVAGDHADILMVKLTPPDAGGDDAIAELYWASNHTGVGGYFNQKGAAWINPPQGDTFTYSPMVTADYLIRVWGFLGSESYALKMKKVTANVDDNNDEGTADEILAGANVHTDSVSDVIAQNVDGVDFFKFQGKTNMHINATLDSVDFDLDMGLPTIYINLFNSTGHQYSESELDVLHFSADPEGYIEGDLPKNDTYYLKIECWGGAGNYDLDLTANTPPQVVVDWLDENFEMFIWENGQNDSLVLDNVFADFDGDDMTFTSDAGTNADMSVSIDAAFVATFTPTPGFKGPTCVNITAEDALGATGTVEVCAMVYGINHAPVIVQDFNETYPNRVLGMKYNEVLSAGPKEIHLANYFNDSDEGDKHWYSVTGNDLIYISFAEETPVTPDHFHTGLITIVAPSEDVTESVQFFSKDNGWPPLTSEPLNLTIQVSSGEIKILSKPGGELRIDEDSHATFRVKDYVYFKQPPPPNDSIEYTVQSSSNLTITITDGIANITPAPDHCGSENVLFMGDAVNNDVSNTTTVKVSVKCINDPPVLDSYAPTGTTLEVPEGGNLTFSIDVTDIDTDLDLIKYKWFVNGAQQATIIDIFEYRPTYDAAGVYNISVSFNDTDVELFHEWTGVVVTNTNREPVNVRIITPDHNSTVRKGKTIEFKAGGASDPDGDVINYTWYDGTVVMGYGQVLEHKFKKKGDHNITLEVLDGQGGSAKVSIDMKVKDKKVEQPGFEILVMVAAVLITVLVLSRKRRR